MALLRRVRKKAMCTQSLVYDPTQELRTEVDTRAVRKVSFSLLFHNEKHGYLY